MFDAANLEANSDTELIPYWIYEGPVKVERRVPMLPFSREVQRLKWLKQSLTLYRLTFGQPRQEDLLEYLNSSLGYERRRSRHQRTTNPAPTLSYSRYPSAIDQECEFCQVGKVL